MPNGSLSKMYATRFTGNIYRGSGTEGYDDYWADYVTTLVKERLPFSTYFAGEVSNFYINNNGYLKGYYYHDGYQYVDYYVSGTIEQFY